MIPDAVFLQMNYLMLLIVSTYFFIELKLLAISLKSLFWLSSLVFLSFFNRRTALCEPLKLQEWQQVRARYWLQRVLFSSIARLSLTVSNILSQFFICIRKQL